MRPQSPTAPVGPLQVPLPGEYSCLYTDRGSDESGQKTLSQTQYVLTVHDTSGRSTLKRNIYLDGTTAGDLSNFESRGSLAAGDAGALVFDDPAQRAAGGAEIFIIAKKHGVEAPSRVLELGAWVLTGKVALVSGEVVRADVRLNGPHEKRYGSRAPLPEPPAVHFSRSPPGCRSGRRSADESMSSPGRSPKSPSRDVETAWMNASTR